MKNFLKISLIIAVFFTAFVANASEEDFSLKVKSEKGKTVSFSINDAKNVNLSIYSLENETLFGEKINSKGIVNRTYDLKAFPEGNYILEVETSSKLAQYAIKVVGNTASISEVAISETFKPVFKNENGMVYVDIANADKTDVEISLVDEFNTQLYTETFNGKATISKKFDINQALSDKLTFVVKYKNQIFAETIATR